MDKVTIENTFQAENTIQPQEMDLFSLFFEKSTDLFSIISPEGMLLFVNQAWERMLGYSDDDIKGRSFFDFIHPDDAEKAKQEFLGQFEGDQSCLSSCRLLCNTGAYKWLEWSVNAHDGMKNLIAVGRDISDRKLAEDELMIREERYRLLAENARDVIWTMQLDGTITYISPAVELLRGFTVEEAMNQPIDQIITPDSQKIVIGYIQRLNEAYALGMPLEDFRCENEYYCKDGSTLWTEVFVHPHMGGKSKSPTILGVTRDITERKQFEARLLEQTNDLKELIATRDKFFSIIAHDLRSPFNGFLSMLQYMEESILTMSLFDVQKFIKMLGVSASNLFMLLENLLEWSRIQTGTYTTNFKPFVLRDRAESSCELILESANKKKIAFELDIPEELIVFADERMVEGIFRNLTSNAIKFSPNTGKISITAKKNADNSVEVIIRDNGIGMSDKLMEGLFKLGVDISRKGTEGEPSSGLGLILVKEFTDKMGGKIWVESEEGKGSAFHFTLPSGSH